MGFDRNDPATIHEKHLPIINNKGMVLQYAVTHEDFVWKVRCEPGVLEVFETVYNDKDLIVSFDAIGFGFPTEKICLQMSLGPIRTRIQRSRLQVFAGVSPSVERSL